MEPNPAVLIRPLPKPKRHDTYYIPNGDVVFQVEDALFRVHRYFFERESALFRDMLSLPAPISEVQNQAQQSEGLSDEKPIHLPQVSKEEFSHFLWVFYNPTYSNYNASGARWVAILRLAHLWDFPMIRELAFRQLEKEPPATRLALADRFDAPTDWRARALTELVIRREPLSRAEGRELGLEMALKVAEMRERALGEESRRPSRRLSPVYSPYVRRSPPVEGRRRRISRSPSRSRSPSPPPIVIQPPLPITRRATPQFEPIVYQPTPVPTVQPWAWQQPLVPTVPNDGDAGVATSRIRRAFRFFKRTGRR